MAGIKISVLIASIHEWVCHGCLRRRKNTISLLDDPNYISFPSENKLEKEIQDQIKGHLQLQYESNYIEASVIQDIPISIQAKISQNLYKPYIEKVPLFRGCSSEFINQIVIRLHEEFFLPGEVILEQGNMVDQIYFVSHGVLEEVGIAEDGSKETLLLLEPNSSFGEIAILCNIPLPYAVRVSELCRLFRLDKRSFISILHMYFFDGRTVLNNVLEAKESNIRIKLLESDISFHIAKQESEFALGVNNAAYHGDLYHLKGFIRAGADPNRTDYDGRSPLHLAASKGFEDIVFFLIQEGVNINSLDKFGNSPLFEAIKNGHDRVASILFEEGASLNIDDPAVCLCTAVSSGDYDFLKRLLSYGADPNSKDYNHRTPLHVACSKGYFRKLKVLVEAGGNILSKDRWQRTPLDEAYIWRNKVLSKLQERTKSPHIPKHNLRSNELADRSTHKICTVFPFHPSYPNEKCIGAVKWVPSTLKKLIWNSKRQLEYPTDRGFTLLSDDEDVVLLSEDGGEILDVNMISDEQKLYLISERALLIEREE